MSEATQEGIVMMFLLVGMVIVWGIWLTKMLRKWADEEVRWAARHEQIRLMEQRRHEARNYRKHD
jgi:hypothetical protein